MSEARRSSWVRKGSPFQLMRPARDLRDVLRRYGYTVYDIGNKSHLEHEPPEDHTPYSETGWPGEARYGIGYAIDIMPPKAGSGLPSLQRLGAQLYADRNKGVAGISWLKYMNWEPEANNSGPCYQDSWKPTHRRRPSSDRGHIHLSGLTGFEDSTIGAGYDPVARIRGGDDMPLSNDDVKRVAAAVAGWVYGDGQALYSHARDADRQAGMIRTELAELREQVATIQTGAGPTDEQLERVLRRVIGSVDGTSPA